MGTFSKSLASLGGYMAAEREVAEFVRHASRPFIFSASITPAKIMQARKAIRKAVGILKERKGFSLVEILSPCPVNLKMDAKTINRFIDEQMRARTSPVPTAGARPCGTEIPPQL